MVSQSQMHKNLKYFTITNAPESQILHNHNKYFTITNTSESQMQNLLPVVEKWVFDRHNIYKSSMKFMITFPPQQDIYAKLWVNQKIKDHYVKTNLACGY